jgi:hypothetical protein
MAQWRNRIVEQGMLDAQDAVLNPVNWRRHPEEQALAMDAVLDEVGWVQNVIVNRTTGHVIDGELRILRARERGEQVPVTFVELTLEEEQKILATFDPISQMATPDTEVWGALIGQVETESLFLRDMLDRALKDVDGEEHENDKPKNTGDIPSSIALQPFEHHDYVVLLFHNSMDFANACDRLGVAQSASPIGQGRFKIGVGRVVDGKDAIKKLCGL